MAIIFGEAGDDTIDGTNGADYLHGRDGNDTLSGGDGNDVLFGDAGNDILFGGEGDDRLSGGVGADAMTGGNGNDTYFVDDTGDAVFEFLGGGIDTVISALKNYRIGANIERLTLAEIDNGDNDLNGSGNDLDNRILGNSGGNSLMGQGGDDNIDGFGGNDIISGGSGDDRLDGGVGVDTLSYKVGATAGVSVDLSISGKRQNTGAGFDTIKNFENLEGTAFADRLTGDNAANKIAGLGGNDVIRGRGGDDDITAGSDADTIRFDSAATNGVDRIRQFALGSDKLEFHTADGYAADSTLTFGSAAIGAGPQGVYDIATGQLFYDADGEGAGAAILIAQFDRGLALSNGDFIVINDAP